MASLEDLIPTVNKLQDVIYDAGIDTLDLPVLAVIGSQSSGKSSILETLVGKDFLPRGTGIVTRRPLILQLVNLPVDSPLINNYVEPQTASQSLSQNLGEEWGEGRSSEHYSRLNSKDKSSTVSDQWGEFLHMPGRRFYDFDQIKQEIENETARIAGKNKGISRIPINLKIYSPHVLNLTLIDLPGITKVPIGEQPADIEKQIRNLILEYVAKPNCIMLAVCPANIDLVNSESLKLAREVDPQGKRTIGVITKLDLMDSGTNALDILSGKVYPLKLGFVGVVNRSQQDIQEKRSIDDSLLREEEYFAKHPFYRTISTRCGTKFLAKKLNQVLLAHIREKLPDIKARLNTLIGQTEQELASYGDCSATTQENKAALILQMMNRFATNFVSSIEGTSSDISTKELCGGARIYYIYNNIFGNSLNSINPTSNLSVSDIRTAIRNSTGPRPSLFVPELAFDLLVKPQIKLLQDPALRCVELVYEELMKICHNCGTPALARYPKLQSRLIEVVSDLLRERLGPTRSYVESLIDIHRAFINTNHPGFLSATEAMADIVETRKKKLEVASRAADLKRKRKDADGSSSAMSEAKNGISPRIDSDSTMATSDTESDDEKDTKQSKDSFLNYFFGKDQRKGEQLSDMGDKKSIATDNYFSEVPEYLQMEALQIREASGEQGNAEHPELTEKEELECELIKRLIVSYFGIVREMIQDQIPKAVMCFLVNFCKEEVQNRLVSRLYKETLFEELLMEDQNLAQDRAKCLKILDTYRKASLIIGDIL
ncbi:HHR001Cp [Eremothecium sinecaudum]|uniref:dynamin GTPase n=1 Tax=Eremothecium sinecaudum TaxID=45286 RepID=A0A120K2W3_9SACH|nr:HHR001Cp [Eremothecium sinecaudum]AMD22770.1 HHR001Cp [Eremothecium sinecaudum]